MLKSTSSKWNLCTLCRNTWVFLCRIIQRPFSVISIWTEYVQGSQSYKLVFMSAYSRMGKGSVSFSSHPSLIVHTHTLMYLQATKLWRLEDINLASDKILYWLFQILIFGLSKMSYMAWTGSFAVVCKLMSISRNPSHWLMKGCRPSDYNKILNQLRKLNLGQLYNIFHMVHKVCCYKI